MTGDAQFPLIGIFQPVRVLLREADGPERDEQRQR
jgi:hypothetical protein